MKITDHQKSRILYELKKASCKTEIWNDLDVVDKGAASDIISAFHRGDRDIALNQLKHLIPTYESGI